MCYSKKSSYFEFALGRSYESEALLVEENVPGDDFKKSKALLSDVKKDVVKLKKISNKNVKRRRNRRWIKAI